MEPTAGFYQLVSLMSPQVYKGMGYNKTRSRQKPFLLYQIQLCSGMVCTVGNIE